MLFERNPQTQQTMNDRISREFQLGRNALECGFLKIASEYFQSFLKDVTSNLFEFVSFYSNHDICLLFAFVLDLMVNNLGQLKESKMLFERATELIETNDKIKQKITCNPFWTMSKSFIQKADNDPESAYVTSRLCYHLLQKSKNKEYQKYLSFVYRNILQNLHSMPLWPIDFKDIIYSDLNELTVIFQPHMIDPQHFHDVIIRFFKNSNFPRLQNVLVKIHQTGYETKIHLYWEDLEKDVFENDLLHKFMKSIYICDVHIEILFTLIRKHLLLANPKIKKNFGHYAFLAALQQQCKMNEYVYYVSEEEKKYMSQVIDDEDTLIQCYQKPCLKSSSCLTQEINKRVKQQYEDNPYPQWKYLHLENNPLEKDTYAQPYNILFVGCGTGKQVIFSAKTEPNSLITAIDLSATSIAYAKKMAKKYQVGSKIKFFEMNLFDIPKKWREKFDAIHCTGVLHHVQDTEKALKILQRCLSNKGQMHLALYSSLARQLLPRKPFVDVDDLRKTRKTFIEEALVSKAIIEALDFYTTSGCRDLLFHEFEKQFTIPQVMDLLSNTGLVFRRFVTERISRMLVIKYIELYGSEDPWLSRVDLWNCFENMFPQTFKNMYQFVVSKKNK